MDLRGREFGRITVLEKVPCPADKSQGARRHSWWRCQCQCGTVAVIPGRSLVHRSTRSCGCMRRDANDIAGRTFVRLTVVERAPSPEHIVDPMYSRRAWWMCKCSCGGERVANGPDIRGGKTKSCGCLAREQKSAAMLAIRAREREINGTPPPAERKLISEEKQRRRRQILCDQQRAAAALAPKVRRSPSPPTQRRDSPWTPALIQGLRDMWPDGSMSAAVIGAHLGVSANAVVGKAHRLHLDPRPSPIKQLGDRPSALTPIPAVPRLVHTLPPLPSELTAEPPPPRLPPIQRPVLVRPAPVSEPVRLDRRRTCEFLSGERRRMVACGEHVVTGSPYCPEHHRLCFVPIRRRAGVEEAA